MLAMKERLQKYLLGDLSVWSLLLSNAITIFFAMKDGWDLPTLLWIYWIQSVIIGIFNVVRILRVREVSNESILPGDHPAKPARSKGGSAIFFACHYGIFHFTYLMALLSSSVFAGAANAVDMRAIAFAALVFFGNHLFSFLYNARRDSGKQNTHVLMFYPYARIIPMHFMLALSLPLAGALPFFLVLKTLADVIMHSIEHNVLRKGEVQVAVV